MFNHRERRKADDIRHWRPHDRRPGRQGVRRRQGTIRGDPNSATVQDNRQLTKAEIIAAAIEWFEGIAGDLSDADFHQIWVDPALRKIQAGA
jgi:hypothetical protein